VICLVCNMRLRWPGLRSTMTVQAVEH
jgi:hypothetical protein